MQSAIPVHDITYTVYMCDSSMHIDAV